MTLLQFRSICDAMRLLNTKQSELLWSMTDCYEIWPIELLRHACAHIGQELKNDTTY